MVLDYLEKNNKQEIAKGKYKPTQSKITLKNKATILARPVGSTGDAIRGFTGDILYVDEAASMPNQVWVAGKPTLLTTAGKIWMSSTPRGKQGFFYDMFADKQNNKRFKVFHISSEEVIKNRPISSAWTERQRTEGLKLLEQERQDMSKCEYGQEYLGLFLEELRQFFPDDIIERCAVLKRQHKPKDNNFLGVDIARLGGDEITYEMIHKVNEDYYEHVENIVKKEQLTTATERDILLLNRMWNIDKIGIDAGSGSLGVGIFDRLLDNPETKRKVIPMNNRTISINRQGDKKQRIFKEDMYENMLAMMEKGQLFLLNDPEIILSLSSVQWEFVTKQNITKIRIFGKYTHIAEGLVRAAWLAKKQKVNKLWITSI